LPFVHFYGKFKFQFPIFNNTPTNIASGKYDNRIPLSELNQSQIYDLTDDIHKEIRGDPSKYFEFEFSNVTATMVTYDDGKSDSDKPDVIRGKKLSLKGILVDVIIMVFKKGKFMSDFIATIHPLVLKWSVAFLILAKFSLFYSIVRCEYLIRW
jgi:hypothetical protein